MVSELSPERLKYHELMSRFIKFLVPGSLIYDIGKSHIHDYRKEFNKFDYRTIDRDLGKHPDILLDIEGLNEISIDDYLTRAEGLLCNGVVEQCDDPIKMIRSCHAMLKSNGQALFGFVLLGYPQHTYDFFRFTESGACGALKRAGFIIVDNVGVSRDGRPSYIYIFCKRN